MTQAISLDQAIRLIAGRGATRRSITAIAGPPGAGKSTAAAAIRDALNAIEPGSAGLLQMDGYHFDDVVLEQRNLRASKGSPQTFDVGGLVAMLLRLRQNTEPEIAVPVFDRSIEIARAGAAIIPQSARHILVEGNYLLLDAAPWNALFPEFDTTLLITADISVLRRRLETRWQNSGLSEDEISGKVDGNDLMNAGLVLSASRAAEYVINTAKSTRTYASRAMQNALGR